MVNGKSQIAAGGHFEKNALFLHVSEPLEQSFF